MLEQHVLDLPPDLADRVQGRARVLEDHRNLAAAQRTHIVFAGLPHVDVAEHYRAFGHSPGAIEDAHHRVGRHRFAGAELADDGNGLALGDHDVDMLHGADSAAAGLELHGEVANIEQRHLGHG